MIDEIYVKPSLCYHGGKVFGKAQNNPEELATTVLAIIVKCLFGGPEFILKMIPVHRLTASFQYDQLEQCGAKIVAVICDGNQVNKSFFKRFETVAEKPWLTKEKNMFLLFDYVHLLKCRWSDLKSLFRVEEASMLKQSKLDFVAVHPKPIER